MQPGQYVVRSLPQVGQLPTTSGQFAMQSALGLHQLPQGTQKLRRPTSPTQYIQQDASGYRTLVTSSAAEALGMSRARSSSSSQLASVISRPELSRAGQTDELPRFGVDDSRPRSKERRSLPPKGSVQSIIEDFKLSMSRAACASSRDLDCRALQNESNNTDSIREAWAHVASTPTIRSGRITPVEGSLEFEGMSLLSSSSCTRLRSPWHSRDAPPRDTTTPSLKAAAAAVVGQGFRSGRLSGISSPRGRGSPLGSPRQMSPTDSARSLMLTAPWQQYKNVANRLQRIQASEGATQSPCSSPRSRRGDSSARGRRGAGTSPRRDGTAVTPRSQSDREPIEEKVSVETAAPREEPEAPELTGTAVEENVAPVDEAHPS